MALMKFTANVVMETDPDDTESNRADAVSALFTDYLESKGMIVDWFYHKDSEGKYAYPAPVMCNEDSNGDPQNTYVPITSCPACKSEQTEPHNESEGYHHCTNCGLIWRY